MTENFPRTLGTPVRTTMHFPNSESVRLTASRCPRVFDDDAYKADPFSMIKALFLK